MTITNVNCETGEISYHEYSPKELAQQLKNQKEAEQLSETQATAKAALLAKLGITQEEATLLLA